ncbi:hypothetical protein K1T71_014001 [Dendrolimus kikuchii]|uniref:Uncharacterized protein n=1 Tax=Dendrolimus kikuchii TaxID=765133 RepID=A0ACC1CGA0_9NEOP|nr:hypothetical protein K1T71_014001 [Dendrolimus kikuchii]
MDLLHIIFDINKAQNICCLCLTSNENNINIFNVIEIFDKELRSSVTLKNMFTTILPEHEIFLDQACNSCTDLMIKLFVILRKSSIKKQLFTSLLGQINEKINQFDLTKRVMTINLYNPSGIPTQVNPSIICNKCDMKFNTREEVIKHTKLGHTQSCNATVCPTCGKKWPTTKQLKAHLNSHNFKQCPYCFKILKTHAHYNKHVRNHLRAYNEVKHRVILKNDFVEGHLTNVNNNSNNVRNHLELDKEAINATSDLNPKSIDGLKENLISQNNEKADYVKTFPEVCNTSQTSSFQIFNEENLYTRDKVEDNNIFDENSTNDPEDSNIVNLNNLKTTIDYIDKAVVKNDLRTLKQLAYETYFNRSTKKTVIDEICINNSGLIDGKSKKLICTDICTPKQCKDDCLVHDIAFHSTNNAMQNTSHTDSYISMDVIEFEQNYTSKNKPTSKLKKYYSCEHCSYKSVAKPNLEAHYNKIHLNTRPYACEICLKSFYRKSNLREHVITHNKTKNITCEVCGSNFASKKTLETHLKIHTGIKKFHCDICNIYFCHKNHLNEHIKRSHMEKLVCCMFCEKKYGLKKDLNRHVARVHQVANYHIL